MPHITHLLDPQRGRASHTKMWTLCGEQVMTRLVLSIATMPPQSVSCKACILANALTAISGWYCPDPNESRGDGNYVPIPRPPAHCIRAIAETALARVRGEQPDAPK